MTQTMVEGFFWLLFFGFCFVLFLRHPFKNHDLLHLMKFTFITKQDLQ